jgi:hypothetical protein
MCIYKYLLYNVLHRVEWSKYKLYVCDCTVKIMECVCYFILREYMYRSYKNGCLKAISFGLSWYQFWSTPHRLTAHIGEQQKQTLHVLATCETYVTSQSCLKYCQHSELKHVFTLLECILTKLRQRSSCRKINHIVWSKYMSVLNGA